MVCFLAHSLGYGCEVRKTNTRNQEMFQDENTYTWAVHKETELFFLICCFTYNLIKHVSFKVLLSTLDTLLPTFFSSSGTCHGTCFAGWREGPVSNFLLSLLSSEIGDLSVRISIVGTGTSPQGPNLESRAAGEQQSFHASSKIHV